MASYKWDIVYYESPNNKFPVYDFIESLSAKAKAKVVNTFDLLSEFGIKLGMPKVRKIIGTPLWELRVLGKDSIRIFYVIKSERRIILLHGFIKKKQKTDKKEINIALERLEDLT